LSAREALIAYSPDSLWIVDHLAFNMSYWEGRLHLYGSPDSQVFLFDRKSGNGRLIMACGTPCWYQISTWIDPDRFVVAGTYDKGTLDSQWRPFIRIFNVVKDTSVEIRGPALSRKDRLRAEDRWGEHLRRIHPDLPWAE
jgi:hypothetical protein